MRIETSDWRRTRGGASQNHIMACSDLHGQGAAGLALLDHLAALPSQGLPRILVNCGDVIDRGNQGLALMDRLMAADAEFDRVELLCGNHEIFAIEALFAMGLDRGPAASQGNFMRWLERGVGGAGVYVEISPGGAMPYWDMARIASARMRPYLTRVAERPRPEYRDGDFLFIHAGVVPGAVEETLALGPFAQVRMGEHWAWMRGDFLRWQGAWGAPGRIIVHGHTPCTDELLTSVGEALPLMDRIHSHNRICLDLGGYDFGHLGAVEICGDRYRFHVIFGEAQ